MFFTRYSPPPSEAIHFEKPSLTEQSHKKSCDINSIISSYKRTGVLSPDHRIKDGFFADVSNIGDFQVMQNALVKSRSEFESLPADVREQFANDPARFANEFFNPAFDDKFIKLGIKRASHADEGTQANPADVRLSAEQQQALGSAAPSGADVTGQS